MDKSYVINIGRQLGSGGRLIGQMLSERLGIGYYDKEILSLAAQESGFCKEIFERNDEKKGFFASFFNSITPIMNSNHGDFYRNQLSDENLFRIQSLAIRKAAEEGSCIFIGRCADYILREHPRCLNVFISAHRQERIERIVQNMNVDEQTAAKLLEQGDKARADFYNFYSSQKWGAAETYDFCFNSSVLGVEATVNLICEIVEQKFFRV